MADFESQFAMARRDFVAGIDFYTWPDFKCGCSITVRSHWTAGCYVTRTETGWRPVFNLAGEDFRHH